MSTLFKDTPGLQLTGIMAGIDEVGRGALAGPVVAAACILSAPLFRRRSFIPHWSPDRRRKEPDCLIADSKQLSPEQREVAYDWLVAQCHYGIGSVEAHEIDAIGILAATQRAMRLALGELRQKTQVDLVLVDGRDAFSFDCPHRSIIRGDQTEPCIAAASIIAKVTRDRWMRELHRRFFLYGFDEHKGYGSEQHIDRIKRFGPCPLHRKSFLRRIFSDDPKQDVLSQIRLLGELA